MMTPPPWRYAAAHYYCRVFATPESFTPYAACRLRFSRYYYDITTIFFSSRHYCFAAITPYAAIDAASRFADVAAAFPPSRLSFASHDFIFSSRWFSLFKLYYFLRQIFPILFVDTIIYIIVSFHLSLIYHFLFSFSFLIEMTWYIVSR